MERMVDAAKYKRWREKVLERDNNQCQVCGSTEVLKAHHIKSWWHSLKERYKGSNGITLCQSCHKKKPSQKHLAILCSEAQRTNGQIDQTGRLFWIKIWTEEWLDGSIREQLTPTERSIWVDLLVMAGRSRNTGIVQSNPNVAYSHEYLANRFKVSLSELEEALGHFQEQARIEETGTGIRIVNWAKYQDPKKR